MDVIEKEPFEVWCDRVGLTIKESGRIESPLLGGIGYIGGPLTLSLVDRRLEGEPLGVHNYDELIVEGTFNGTEGIFRVMPHAGSFIIHSTQDPWWF